MVHLNNKRRVIMSSNLPVILSEEYCAFLEPHQVIWDGKPGQRYTLKTLQQIEPTFMQTYIPFADFSASKFRDQTIFRFPLRKVESKLSNVMYSMERLEQLVEALHNEAHYLLLFLHSVQSIEVIKLHQSGHQSIMFKASINSDDRLNLKHNFFEKMAMISPEQVISYATNITVQVEPGDAHQWAVVHYAGSQEPEVLKLAKSQCVIPWVSTAYEITNTCVDRRGGHIFCSLPLPSEERAPFKVDVNGSFAVCSNRRSLKWESQERQDDEEGTWNQYLVEKSLPHCYVMMIEHLMSCNVSCDVVYSCYPSVQAVIGTPWESLLKPFYAKLFATEVVYTPANGGQWIQVQEAFFFKRKEERSPSVEKALMEMQVSIVAAPDVVWEAESYMNEPVTILTPNILRQYLKAHLTNITLSHDEKLDLLEYCLSDKRFTDLNGLELLPLTNDTFVTFTTLSLKSELIYLSTDSIPHTLLPNVSNRFVAVPLKGELKRMLSKLAGTKITQLRIVDISHIAQLLVHSKVDSWSINQLKKFWLWLGRYSLSYFKGARIIPIKGESVRSKLSKNETIFVPTTSCRCSPLLASALKKYKLILVKGSDFPFLMHEELSKYLSYFNPSDVLSAISEHSDMISLTTGEALELQNFFAQDDDAVCAKIKIICQISMFQTLQNNNPYSIIRAKPNKLKPAIAEEKKDDLCELISDLPLVLSCSKNNQKMLELLFQAGHLVYKSKVAFFKEVTFQHINNRTYPEAQIDKVMMIAVDLVHTLQFSERESFIIALKTVSFLPISTRSRLCISKAYDPSDNQLAKLYKGEPVFPLSPFNSPARLNVLRECGLKTNESITGRDISAIITTLVNENENEYCFDLDINYEALHEKACALVTFCNSSLSDNLFVMTMSTFIHSVKGGWLPVWTKPPLVLSRRTNKKLNWKGSRYGHRLAPSSDVIALEESLSDSTLPWIMGSSICFIKSEVPSWLRHLLSHSKSSLVDKVFKHFEHVIQRQHTLSNDTISHISTLTYEYLSEANYFNDFPLSDCVTVKDHVNIDKWIWIERESCFVSPNETAFSSHPDFHYNLIPFVHILPSHYKKIEDLFLSCGSSGCVTSKQIVSILNQLEERSLISTDQKVDLAIAILKWMIDEDIDVTDVLVPVQSDSFKMLPVYEVVYPVSDLMRCLSPPTDNPYQLVHSKVTKEMAKQLHICSLEARLGIAQDISTQDVGQHEPLIDRLQNILQQYQDSDGYTVVKEMLQNADDAGATELNIMFDLRQHTTSGLYYSGMAKVQGPALIVHNNKSFTKQDFINITKLAAATKQNQSLKIGKFGIGFCSVYHITDIPSFVSSDQLYIFDPTLTHLEDHVQDRTQPGQKALFTSQYFQIQMKPFHNLFGFDSRVPYDGTLFRLPFRTSPSKLSKKCYDPKEYYQLLLDRLEKDGSKLLLFLNHIKKITVSEFSDSNQHPNIKLSIEKFNESDNYYQLPPNVELMNIMNNTIQETWLVSSSQEYDQVYLTASVACKLHRTQQDEEWDVITVDGEMFCFLPLGFIKTGLPVHVSANFAIMSNRRGIWVSDSTEPDEREVLWNRKLMDRSVSNAYYHLLKALQQCSSRINNYVFYKLWPLQNQLMSVNPWNRLVVHLYQLIASDCHCHLFRTIGTGEWFSLSQCKVLQDPILSRLNSKDPSTPSCVYEALTLMHSEPIIDLPRKYLSEIRETYVTFRELEFVDLFFKSILEDFTGHTKLRNDVLLLVLETFSIYLDDTARSSIDLVQFRSILETNPCIPCGSNGEILRFCNEVVDNYSSVAILFTMSDNRFPVDSFEKSPPCRRTMLHLGLIHNKLPHDLLVETIVRIPPLYDIEPDKTLCKVKVIIECLNLMEELPYESKLPTLAFLPIFKKPDKYYLPWKGGECKHLLPPHEVMHGKDLPHLVGSQQCILDHTTVDISERTLQLLSIHCKPEIDTVFNQLMQLIEICRELSKRKGMNDEVKEFVGKVYSSIIQFLEQIPSIEQHPLMVPVCVERKDEEPITLRPSIASLTCIWTGHEFVTPLCVAKHWKTNGPILYPLPPVLNNKLHLINAFGCQNRFLISRLLSALALLYEMYMNKPVPSHCYDLLRETTAELDTHTEEEFKEFTEFYLPDTSLIIHKVSDLVYMDVTWCDTGSDTCFVNDMVTSSLAKKMKVSSTRQQSLSQHKDQFEHFGQHEDLTLRINNILRDYPLDVTFMKELVQNADDAGASKMVFIFDKRTHETERIFTDNWKELQGPALLVWNDSVFSENDLKGIQRLGFGGKRQNDSTSETIGKFGIGFNVVYHITDCPAFVTYKVDGSQTLCILDPQCRYVSEATNAFPGGRYNNINSKGGIWDKFPDVASTFSLAGVKGCSSELAKDVTKRGTLFRFPFRSLQCSQTSKILHPDSDENEPPHDTATVDEADATVTADELVGNIQEWADDIKMLLLFLTNIKCLEVYLIEGPRNAAKMKCFLSYSNSMPNEGKRSDYKSACKDYPKPAIVHYTLNCKTEIFFSEKKEIRNERWFIQQGIGNINEPDENWKFAPTLKPRHGIAARLEPPVKEHFKGKLFCFLPLPICTDVPVHLNGQFILTSARRDVWKPSTTDSSDINSMWNEAILKALSSSYASLLQTLASIFPTNIFTSEEYKDLITLQSDVSRYFWLFPTKRKLKTGESFISFPNGEWEAFSRSVFTKLAACNAKILPSVSCSPGEPALKIKWSTLFNKEDCANQSYFFMDQSYFFMEDVGKKNDKKDISQVLKQIGMNINIAPYPVRKAFQSVETTLPVVNRDSVYQYCREHCSDKLPCSLQKTKFKETSTFITILQYLLSGKKEFPIHVKVPYVPSTWPHDSPFLLTADDQLRLFDKTNPVICSKFFSLFPQCWNHFLHPKLVDLNIAPSYFYSHNEHGNSLIMEIVSLTLPSCLKNETCVERKYLPDQMIYQFLKCFHSDVFKPANVILSQWALIPSQQHLFIKSNKQCLLPFVNLEECKDQDNGDENMSPNSANNEHVVEILTKIGMPALDVSILQHVVEVDHKRVTCTDTDLVRAFECPNVNEPSQILDNLLLCHQDNLLLCHQRPRAQTTQLLCYLGQINFKTGNAKSVIKALPFFEDINGSLSSLSEEVYVWPDGIPKDGLSIWQKHCRDVTFLSSQGDWRNLGDMEALGIKEIQCECLYLKYIFPFFQDMSDEERKQHLLFIREEVLDICLVKAKGGNTERKFIHELSILPIIRNESGHLHCAMKYFDHRKEIFLAFGRKFQLLPRDRDYRSKEWMDFLVKIGLVNKVDKKTFIELCNAVECRNHCMFEDIIRASTSLLDYLLKSLHGHPSNPPPWDNPMDVLKLVSCTEFVNLHKLPFLHNEIAPQCVPDDNPITEESCHLAALNGSAIVDCANLLWTVKPIINIPQQGDVIKKALQKCGVIVKYITTNDVINNLKTIATKSKYADVSLFDHYPHSNPKRLLEVIIKHFDFLSREQPELSNMKCLQTMKCVPVCVDVNQSQKLVLVEPSTVVNDQEADDFKPFLHSLHLRVRSRVPSTFLEYIGIQATISSKHCFQVLQTMYNRYCTKGGTLDVNTAEKARKILLRLLQTTLLQTSDCNNVTKLYLPGMNNQLMLSTDLLYIDDQQFSNTNCDFEVNSIFRVDAVGLNDFELKLCRVLPVNIRPHPLSLSCEWRLMHQCAVVGHTNFTQVLQQSLKNRHLKETFKGILKSLQEQSKFPEINLDSVGQHFDSVIVGAEVNAVKNLFVSLYRKDKHIPVHVCSSPVKYFIKRNTTGPATVYIDSNVGAFDSKFSVNLPMARFIIRSALWKSGCDIEMPTQELELILSTLMEAHTDEHFLAILRYFQIDHDEILQGQSSCVLLPELGAQVPSDLHNRLDGNQRDAVFRFKEWVAYKQENDFYIFAKIEHPVFDGNGTMPDNVHDHMYSIMYNDVGAIEEVSILKLYKFLPQSPADENEEESPSDHHQIDTPVYHPNLHEGRRWLRQSVIDLKACESVYNAMITDVDLAGHVCFLAHQVAEKALKGGMYVVFGSTDLHGHKLIPLVSVLRHERPNDISPDCVVKVRQLDRYYISTRYPNACDVTRIPADCYKHMEAEIAMENAQYIQQTLFNLDL